MALLELGDILEPGRKANEATEAQTALVHQVYGIGESTSLVSQPIQFAFDRGDSAPVWQTKISADSEGAKLFKGTLESVDRELREPGNDPTKTYDKALPDFRQSLNLLDQELASQSEKLQTLGIDKDDKLLKLNSIARETTRSAEEHNSLNEPVEHAHNDLFKEFDELFKGEKFLAGQVRNAVNREFVEGKDWHYKPEAVEVLRGMKKLYPKYASQFDQAIKRVEGFIALRNQQRQALADNKDAHRRHGIASSDYDQSIQSWNQYVDQYNTTIDDVIGYKNIYSQILKGLGRTSEAYAVDQEAASLRLLKAKEEKRSGEDKA